MSALIRIFTVILLSTFLIVIPMAEENEILNDGRIQQRCIGDNWNTVQALYQQSKHPSLQGLKYREKFDLSLIFYKSLKTSSNWKQSLSEKYDEHESYFKFNPKPKPKPK
eukprot:429260_1